MSLFFVNGGIVTRSEVQAAQADKVPAATVTDRTLYKGYKSYTIKLKNKSKDALVTFKSSNKSIASVSNKGVINPINVGSATITASISQNGKKYTSKIKVTVEWPYVNMEGHVFEVVLGSTYTYKGKAYGMNQADLEWRSSDTSVATIDKKTGVLTPVAEGTTKISYYNIKTYYSHSFPVTVTKPFVYTPPVGSDKAKYMSGLDLSKEKGTYYTTKKEEYIETSRFVLYLGKGVEIPINVVELINYIMDMIEEETGYEFYAKWQGEYNFGMDSELDMYFKNAKQLKEIDPEHNKIGIVAVNNDAFHGAYASGGYGVLLSPSDIKILDGGAGTIIHELLHVVMFRNGKSMNGAFDEGFTTYYTARIIDKDKRLNCTYDSYFQLGRYKFPINENSAEQLYIVQEQGSERYGLGFRLLHFLHEKYGDKSYKKLHEKVCEMLDDSEHEASTELIAKVIKEEISKDFFVEFAKWHKLNMKRFNDQDLSLYGDWNIINGTLYRYYGDDSHVLVPNSVTSIGFEAFTYCMSIMTIEIPSTVTSIGPGAFYGCKNLKEINIPDSVSKMYEITFGDCSSLEKVKLPNKLTEIPLQTFRDCSSLKDIIIPNSIKKIGDHAFLNCTSLKYITLPDKLEKIGYGSFDGCSNLREIHIPNSVKDIGEWAFCDCKSLTDVILPRDLKKIEDNLFWGCTSLKNILLPDYITEIGSCAFNFTSLSEVKIPKGVTKIGEYAFGQCKNLKIEIPESVKSIDKDTFYSCDNMTIYGKAGSYAEGYAKNNNIEFLVITDETISKIK
jgi:hypothetical protein